jgi:RNA polymerase sigma-70 factor (ECF subfamily)
MVGFEQDTETSRTDEELLLRLQAGDELAFTLLYRRRQGAIYRFALHMTGDLVVAEDVTQEVFLTLLGGRSNFDAARGPLAAFLFGVARKQILKRLRRLKEFYTDEDCSIHDDLLGNLVRRETVEQVRRAVLSLPALYREVVVLCDLEESSYEDASIVLECPVGTVRSRLNRGRAMLAQKLRPTGTPLGRNYES